MDDYGGLLSTISGDDINRYAGAQTMASGFASMANAYIDYGALKVEAGNLNIRATDKFMQAEQVELQAQEKANALRKQFIGAIGNATYNAAARGVKVSSANLQQNIERSAGEMDEDIRKSKKSASMQAENLRMQGRNLQTQAKISKQAAKARLVTGILGGISDTALGYGIYSSSPKTTGGSTREVNRLGDLAGSVGRKPTRG